MDSILPKSFYINRTIIPILLFTIFSFFYPSHAISQTCSTSSEVTEYLPNKVSGQVDFTIIGNTQNPHENNDIGTAGSCQNFRPILTTTDNLSIPNSTGILAAYLYWSGTGPPIRNVRLNNQSIQAERCWVEELSGQPYFSSYADVTELVQNTGEGTYTFTGLDNTAIYRNFACAQETSFPSTLYGGWSIVVIYETNEQESYTIFYYDGLRLFQNSSFSVNIRANVFEQSAGSYVGVIAWEGDKDSRITGDQIRLNGRELGNDFGAYQSRTNIFNGTNSFSQPTNNQLYNADFDKFPAEDVVEEQLNTAAANFEFFLGSGDDLILLNSIILRIPNQAPDAIVELPDTYELGCLPNASRTFDVTYRYENLSNASRPLPEDTPISFYLNSINGEKIGEDLTEVEVQPGDSATGTATLTLPDDYLGEFEIFAYIDDPDGQPNNYGVILELLEENNTSSTTGYIDQEYTNLEIPVSICEGESYIVDGVEYRTNQNIPFSLPTEVGGCDSIGIVQLRIQPVFNDPPVQVTICEDETYQLPGGDNISRPPSDEAYVFVDTLQSSFQCDSIVTTELFVEPIQRATFDIEICIGQEYTLPGEGKVSQTGTYIDTLTNAASNGCDSIITTNLNVIDIVYPNAFAPNNNGNNEGFKAILPTSCPIAVTNYQLQIYNKWGELVFETTDISEAWNGLYKEDEPMTDYYLWYATYDTPFQEGIKRTGGVTLLQ